MNLPITSRNFTSRNFTSRNFGFIVSLVLCGVITEPGWNIQRTALAGRIQTTVAANQFDESDKKLVAGLRRRRLFELAEKFCLEKMQTKNLSAVDQVEIANERIRTQTARAVVSPTAGRASQWGQVDSIVVQFEKEFPQHPRMMLIKTQLAMSKLARAKLLQQEIAAEMSAPTAQETAISTLAEARAIFTKLEIAAQKQFESQRNQAVPPEAIGQAQLQTLGSNVKYQLATANLIAAQLYPEDDELNRIAALNEVLRRLSEVQRETSDAKFLWWQTKVDEIACLRLLGQYPQAVTLANSIQRDETPVAIKQSLFKQQALLALKTSDTAMLTKMWDKSKSFASRSPEFEIARLRLLMGLVGNTIDQEKEKWLQTASALTKDISQRHGGYWHRRAELVLIGDSATGVAASGNSTGNDGPTTASDTEVDMIGRIADQAKRKGNLDDAIKGYLRASSQSFAINQSEQGVVYAYRAGEILEQQQKFGDAAKILVETSIANPTVTMSPSVHLRGCWQMGQRAKSKTNQADSSESDAFKKEFVKQLELHVNTWPNSKTVDQARFWLAAQYQSQSQWRSAVETYLKINPADSRFGEGVENASRCAAAELNEVDVSVRKPLRSAAKSVAEPFKAAFVAAMSADDVESSISIANARAHVANALAQLELSYDLERADLTIARLNGVLEQVDLEDEIQATVRHWLAIAYASEVGGESQADESFGQTQSTSNGLAKELVSTIDRLAERAGQKQIKSLMKIKLEVVDRQLSESIESAKLRWQLERAKTLGRLERYPESIDLFESLVKQHPNDGSIIVPFARTLRLDERAESQAKAISQWRKIAARSKPQTSLWFQAKYNVAELLIESGNKPEANKLLQYIKTIPPGWDESPLKLKFEKLLIKSQSK
jgi:tetratricopeptide (TPR) repeat protein